MPVILEAADYAWMGEEAPYLSDALETHIGKANRQLQRIFDRNATIIKKVEAEQAAA